MCVRFGRICFQVFNREKNRWQYIRYHKWINMPESILEKYDY